MVNHEVAHQPQFVTDNCSRMNTEDMVYFFYFPSAASCLSFVPEKGTVGASGDLAPLSHLALGLMGEGKMWSPKSGWADAKYVRSTQNCHNYFSIDA